MFFSKRAQVTGLAASKVVELTEAELGMVAGGQNPGPGFGVATAFNLGVEGATNVSHVLIATTNAPAQAAISAGNPSTVAGGQTTAGTGNPSQSVGLNAP
jgi:hypothetical protein